MEQQRPRGPDGNAAVSPAAAPGAAGAATASVPIGGPGVLQIGHSVRCRREAPGQAGEPLAVFGQRQRDSPARLQSRRTASHQRDDALPGHQVETQLRRQAPRRDRGRNAFQIARLHRRQRGDPLQQVDGKPAHAPGLRTVGQHLCGVGTAQRRQWRDDGFAVGPFTPEEQAGRRRRVIDEMRHPCQKSGPEPMSARRSSWVQLRGVPLQSCLLEEDDRRCSPAVRPGS